MDCFYCDNGGKTTMFIRATGIIWAHPDCDRETQGIKERGD